MAPSEYSTPGGGGKLKLKGSKTSNGRIEKKKKKSSSSKKSSVPGSGEEREQQKNQQEQQLTTTTSATASGAEEEPRTDEHEPSSASGSAGAGKTEAERKYEEMRRKRVCINYISFYYSLGFGFILFGLIDICYSMYGVDVHAATSKPSHYKENEAINVYVTNRQERLTNHIQLQERLKREGVKTHKERVEELNKYLSRLSEHHDMYVSFSIPFPLDPFPRWLHLISLG